MAALGGYYAIVFQNQATRVGGTSFCAAFAFHRGAIAGIVVGSVAGASLLGFALFWFVIKKKSFADLAAIFKKK